MILTERQLDEQEHMRKRKKERGKKTKYPN